MATYVLIPGAGGDGWQWHLVVRELEARGQVGIPVTLPSGDDGAGWNEYADAVVAAIGDRRDLVLVAQSLAGFTAPLVCERLHGRPARAPQRDDPAPRRDRQRLVGERGQRRGAPRVPRVARHPGTDAQDDRVMYFHDVPDDIVREAFARGEPQQSMTPMGQPWPLEAWPDVPTRVLAGLDDRLFPVDFQRRVARERLGIEADVIEGGHMVALSHPIELAEQLERYREQVARA